MHQAGGADVVTHQHFVELGLGDLVGGLIAQGIVAVFFSGLRNPRGFPGTRPCWPDRR